MSQEKDDRELLEQEKDLINLPDEKIYSGKNNAGFAYFKAERKQPIDKNKEEKQLFNPDGLAWLDLQGEERLKVLNSTEVERLMRATYISLDNEATQDKVDKSGATASSVYYDGKNKILPITK